MITITDISITPNPVSVNSGFLIQVGIVEIIQSWQDLLDSTATWNSVLNGYATWQELNEE